MSVLRRLLAVLAILFVLTACAPTAPPPVLKPGSLLFETPDGAVTATGVNYQFQGEKFFLSEYESLSNGTIYLVSVYFGDKPKEYYWFVPGKTVVTATTSDPVAGAKEGLQNLGGGVSDWFIENEPRVPIVFLALEALLFLGLFTTLLPYIQGLKTEIVIKVRVLKVTTGDSVEIDWVDVPVRFRNYTSAQGKQVFEANGGVEGLTNLISSYIENWVRLVAAGAPYIEMARALSIASTKPFDTGLSQLFPMTELDAGATFVQIMVPEVNWPASLETKPADLAAAKIDAQAALTRAGATDKILQRFMEANGFTDPEAAARAYMQVQVGSAAGSNMFGNLQAMLTSFMSTAGQKTVSTSAGASVPVLEDTSDED